MLPDYLEELIWQGKARWRTWCTGGAAVARIPVTKGTYIVLTSFTYFPFVDTEMPTDWFSWQGQFIFRQVHQVILYSGKNKFQFNFRDWYNLTQDQMSGSSILIPVIGEPKVQNCYCVFDENVRVNVRPFVAHMASTWVNIDTGKMPNTTNELPAPLYAGIAAQAASTNTVRGFQFSVGNTAVDPTNGQINNPALFVPNGNPQFQEKVFALAPPTAIASPSADGMQYPLLNFQYVEVLQPRPGDLRP